MHAVLIAFVLIFAPLSAHAQSQQPPDEAQPAERKEEPAPDQRGTRREPLVIDVMPAERDAEQARENERERKRQATNDIWMAVLTGFLVFFAGAQAWYTRQTLEGLRYARQAARAATRSANLAQQALRGLERPYLFVEPTKGEAAEGDVTAELEYFVRAETHFTFKNFGRSPGVVDSIAITAVINENLLGSEIAPNRPDFTEDHIQEVQVIVPVEAPSEEFFRRTIVQVSQRTHARAARGDIELPLWVFGRVRYHAVFGTQYERGFCWKHVRGDTGWRETGGAKHNYDRQIPG